MSALTLASDPEDATALAAAEAHHARLAGKLAGRVALLLTATGRDPGAAARLHTGLVTFCDRDLLPHAAAKEAVLYPVARQLPDTRLLIESLVGEHRCMAALVEALRGAREQPLAAAEARALQVLFEEHVAKENGLVLPLLAAAPEVRLPVLLAEVAARTTSLRTDPRTADPRKAKKAKKAEDMKDDDRDDPLNQGGGCGCGGCACGAQEIGDPELDVRTVPHAVRHATVFHTLDTLPPDSAIVLVASHDPLPLLAQLEERRPGVFATEYLERGPESWRLRFSHRAGVTS
ncbi:DUF2249 domain-containing protein [Streptomyces sp. NPDC057877]|uniref:DUF2249 domain-containing protein n=1 Tax=Streptomyces sp. NPDC057877 TaxID=3346269 RepID=UPI00367574F9